VFAGEVVSYHLSWLLRMYDAFLCVAISEGSVFVSSTAIFVNKT